MKKREILPTSDFDYQSLLKGAEYPSLKKLKQQIEDEDRYEENQHSLTKKGEMVTENSGKVFPSSLPSELIEGPESSILQISADDLKIDHASHPPSGDTN